MLSAYFEDIGVVAWPLVGCADHQAGIGHGPTQRLVAAQHLDGGNFCEISSR